MILQTTDDKYNDGKQEVTDKLYKAAHTKVHVGEVT